VATSAERAILAWSCRNRDRTSLLTIGFADNAGKSECLILYLSWLTTRHPAWPRYGTKELRDVIDDCYERLQGVASRDVIGYEELLADFEAILWPTHYMVLTIKKYLGDLYGLTEGYLYPQLNMERFQKKIDYLRDYIKAIEKVDGGLTKWKGLALHTVNRPLMYKANSMFRAGRYGKKEFLAAVEDVMDDLKECVKCLEGEPPGSREFEVAKVARMDLAKLKDVVLFADFIQR